MSAMKIIESWPDVENDIVLLCLYGHFIALRTCLYFRTEIKVTLELHELRFIVLKVHYIGSNSRMIFVPLQILMNCLLACTDLNQAVLSWARSRLCGHLLSVYNWRHTEYETCMVRFWVGPIRKLLLSYPGMELKAWCRGPRLWKTAQSL
jgi:hypothetical protein